MTDANLASVPAPGRSPRPPRPPLLLVAVAMAVAAFLVAVAVTEGLTRAATAFGAICAGVLALVQAWRWWRGP